MSAKASAAISETGLRQHVKLDAIKDMSSSYKAVSFPVSQSQPLRLISGETHKEQTCAEIISSLIRRLFETRIVHLVCRIILDIHFCKSYVPTN